MNWLTHLGTAQPVAHAVLILASVITLGLILGSVKLRGLGLGAAGVLFVGIAAGQAKLAIDPGVLAFARDFGLILFVYTIGMQVGPGFITSLRWRGLPLNLLAALVVLLGSALTLLLAWWLGLDLAAMVGVFAGATTNTPALGAAQETLRALPEVAADRAGLPALGYAVAYPFGILGIIIAMLLARMVFRVNFTAEASAFRRENLPEEEPLERRSVIVTNANLNGLHLHQIPGRNDLAVVVSRVRYQGEPEVTVANATTVLHEGDVLLAVGTRKHLDDFCLIVGRESTEDLMQAPGRVTYRRFVVTNKELLGKKLRHLALTARFGVTVTRVTRADIEMSAVPELELQFGDMLQVVGTDADIDKVAGVLGNSVQELNHTNLIPVFIGIALGVVVGLYPLTLANFPVPVRLGLAGGPLLVAIVLSRIGRLGPLVWYMPVNANILLRELGIALFLACAGLKAGEHFLQVLLEGPGAVWMACGAVITLVPLLVAAAIGRWWMKLNYLDLCGLLSGSMTDPPALAFANTLNNSDAPSVAYATVYPFTMLLRIIAAQLLLLFWLK